MLLTYLFWIILVLAVIFNFIPSSSFARAPLVGGLATIALFVIIGLKIFKTPLQ